MSECTRIFTTFLWKAVKESMAEPLAPPLHEAPGIQARRRYHHPVRCRDLGSLSEADQATGVVSPCCLRYILGIKWQGHVSNEEVLKRASLPCIESILLQVQLRWAGHVTRMEDVRMPKAVFFSELQEGKRDRGTPRKRYKDQLKRQACTSGNQPSVVAAGSLRPRQLALISEKNQS